MSYRRELLDKKRGREEDVYSYKNHYKDRNAARQFHGNARWKTNYYRNKYSPASHIHQSKSRLNKYWKSPTFQSTNCFNNSNYRPQTPSKYKISKDQKLTNFSADDYENIHNESNNTSFFNQFESFTTPKSVNKKDNTKSPEIHSEKSRPRGISLVPISLLLKNDVGLENAIEKESSIPQSEEESSSQKALPPPPTPPPQGGLPSTPKSSDPDKVSRRLIAKVATMDKNNIKHVINNPLSKFDAALKVHARKKLREEIRKQLRTMSFETIREKDGEFFEPDECVDSENIPDAVYDEIGRALGLSLFNERSTAGSECSLNSLQPPNNELNNTDNVQDLIRTEVAFFSETCTPINGSKATDIKPKIDLITKIKNLEDIKSKCREQLKKRKLDAAGSVGNKQNSFKENEIITLSSSSSSSEGSSSSSSEDESVNSSVKQKQAPNTKLTRRQNTLEERVIESFNNIILPTASNEIRNKYEKSMNKNLPEALASIYNICINKIEKKNVRVSNLTAIESAQKKNNSIDRSEEEALQFLVENIQELLQEDKLNADHLSTDRNSSKNEPSPNKYKDISPFPSTTSYVGVVDSEAEKQIENAIIKKAKPQNIVVRKENNFLDKDGSLDRSWERKQQTNKALNSNQCRKVRGKRSNKFTTESIDEGYYCLEGETSGKKRKQDENSTIKARKGNQIQSSFHNDNTNEQKPRASLSNYKNKKNANPCVKFKDKAYPIPDICSRQRTDRRTHNRVSSIESNPIPLLDEQQHKARGNEIIYERINEEVSEDKTAQSAIEGEALSLLSSSTETLELEICGSKTCHDSLYLETVFNSDNEESEDDSFEESSILVEGDKNCVIKGKPQELNNGESIRYTLNDNVGYLTTQLQSLQRENPIEGSNTCLLENSDEVALTDQLNYNQNIQKDNDVDCKNRYNENENSIQNKKISSLSSSVGNPILSTNGENVTLNTMEQEQKPRVWKSPGEKKCIEPIPDTFCSTPPEVTEELEDSEQNSKFQIGNGYPGLNQGNNFFNDMQQTDTIRILSLIQQNKISDAVINNLKDIDLKLMELHRRKMDVDEIILKLQKDKMAIDLSTMQLQNERFLVISSLLSNSNNNLRNSAYPPFNPTSSIISQLGNIENTANLLQILEEMKKSKKSKKKPRIVKKKMTTSNFAEKLKNRKKRCQTDILLEDTASTLFSKDAVKSKMIRDTSPTRLSENADDIFHIDSKRTAKRNVLLKKASESTNKERVCAIINPVVNNSVSNNLSSPENISSKNSTLPNTRSSKVKASHSSINSRNLKECKIMLEKIDPEQLERLSPDSSNTQIDNAANTSESPIAIENSINEISSSSSYMDGESNYREGNFVDTHNVPNGHFLGSKLPITQIKSTGDYIIAASEDGNVYKFHWKTKEMLSTFSKHTEAITGIIVDRNNFVYSISLDGFLRKTSVENFGLEIQFANLQEPLQAIDLEWSTAFIGSRWGNVFTYDVKNNKLFDTLLCSVGSAITALKATKEGPRKILIVSSKGNQIYLRDANTGLLLRTLLIPNNINISSVLLDGGLLHFGSNKNEVYTYDFTTGTKLGSQVCGNGAVSMQLFRNKCFFVGCYDGFVYVVDKTTRSLIGRFPGSGKMILAMEIVGEKIITSSKDNFLQMMDIPKYILAIVNKK